MAPPRSIWRVAADDVLSDGKWHDHAEIIAMMMKLVPPSKAIRVCRNHAAQQRKRRGSTGAPRERSINRDVSIGALHVASQTANNAVRNGVWERSGDRVRLRRDQDATEGPT